MTSTKDVLIAARAKIATPETWTKGSAWRDENGRRCSLKNAQCFCVAGSVWALEVGNMDGRQDVALNTIGASIPPKFKRDIAGFNDHPETTHADVLAVMDAAIAHCR
jgi:hypothetical protein